MNLFNLVMSSIGIVTVLFIIFCCGMAYERIDIIEKMKSGKPFVIKGFDGVIRGVPGEVNHNDE